MSNPLKSSSAAADTPKDQDRLFLKARSYRYEELAKGDSHIIVTINGTPYELRLTKSGKLVLNK